MEYRRVWLISVEDRDAGVFRFESLLIRRSRRRETLYVRHWLAGCPLEEREAAARDAGWLAERECVEQLGLFGGGL